MALTDTEHEELLDLVGALTAAEEEWVDEAHTRLGTVSAAALAILRRRLAAAIDAPARLSVDGDYTVDRTENIRAIRTQLNAAAEAAAAAPNAVGAVTVSYLTRSGRRR